MDLILSTLPTAANVVGRNGYGLESQTRPRRRYLCSYNPSNNEYLQITIRSSQSYVAFSAA